MLGTALYGYAHLLSRKIKLMMHCGMWPIVVVGVIMRKKKSKRSNLVPEYFHESALSKYVIAFGLRYDSSKMGRDFLRTLYVQNA